MIDFSHLLKMILGQLWWLLPAWCEWELTGWTKPCCSPPGSVCWSARPLVPPPVLCLPEPELSWPRAPPGGCAAGTQTHRFPREAEPKQQYVPPWWIIRTSESYSVAVNAAVLLYTYSLGALGIAVATEVESMLFGRNGHDGSINKAQLHDSCIVAPQAWGVMQPNPWCVTPAWTFNTMKY